MKWIRQGRRRVVYSFVYKSLPVVRPAVRETTALGAAYLAALAVGYWSDLRMLSELWQVDHIFEPQMSRSTAADLMDGWTEAVECSKSWGHNRELSSMKSEA